MSMTYWGIVGYGICLNDIDKYLNVKKINEKVRAANPKNTFEEDVFDDNTFYGDPYSNLAEFICETFDEKGILTWDDDGQDRCFLLYTPIYPWRMTEKQPKSLKELNDYLISVLQTVYDATYDQLDTELDYISTWGGA